MNEWMQVVVSFHSIFVILKFYALYFKWALSGRLSDEKMFPTVFLELVTSVVRHLAEITQSADYHPSESV